MTTPRFRILKTIAASILALFFFTVSASASVRPGDNEYVKYIGQEYDYVIHKQDLPLLPDLIKYNLAINKIYQSEFQWTLDEKPTLILTSFHDQTTNGFATIRPNLITQFYSGGSAAIDRFSSNSWLYTLLTHEVNHLYQLNVKRGPKSLPAYIKKVLGNTIVFPLIVPIFPQPNFLIPTFLIEGSAVLNESRFGIGGRLFSGQDKALFLSGVKADQFKFDRLINSNIEFPLTEKYLVGSFFTAWLAQRYGLPKVNSFFKQQSDHYINPLILGSTFIEHFGKSYDELYFLFLEESKQQADLQKSSDEKALTKSYIFTPMNRQGDTILFFTSRDLRKTPQVGSYNRATGEIKLKTIDLPIGKPFLIEDKLYTSSAVATDVENKKFSLVGKNYYSNPSFEDQYVFDLHPEKGPLSVKTNKGFATPTLSSGKAELGPTHSSALYSPTGDAYYFRQSGSTRTAYKNKTPLFSFKGHYGFPADFNSRGELVFIASTEFGTSLFIYSKAGISRISDLDTIADAKLINDSTALIYEVAAMGYEVKRIELSKPSAVKPAVYSYDFKVKNEELFGSLSENPTSSTISVEQTKAYSPFRNLKYSLTDVTYGSTTLTGFTLALSNLFSDPLRQNSIATSLSLNQYEKSFNLRYLNQANRTKWYVGLFYDEDSLFKTSDNTQIANLFERYPYVGWSYPVYQRGHWSSSIGQEYSHRFEESIASFDGTTLTKGNIENYQVITSLSVARRQSYSLSYDTYRNFAFTLGHQTRALAPDWKAPSTSLIGYLQFTFGLPYQQFISLNGGSSYSEASILSLSNIKELKETPFDLQKSLTPGTTLNLKQIQSALVSYKKAIDSPYYLTMIPISLLRVAPYLKSQYFKNQSSTLASSEYLESSIGLEAELVLAHTVRARFGFGYSKKENVVAAKESTDSFHLDFKTQF